METKTETKVISSRIQPLLFLFDTHTGLFQNVIEGISDKDAHNRLNTKANHVAWLTGSLVQQRVEIANLLGSEFKQAANEFFKDYKGIQDNVTYPSLASFKEDWNKITPVLKKLLESVSDEKLDTIFKMEEMSMQYFDLIAFSVHREAYLIGQIGLWRRLMGYDAMKYPM
jgi:hypothetical protein